MGDTTWDLWVSSETVKQQVFRIVFKLKNQKYFEKSYIVLLCRFVDDFKNYVPILTIFQFNFDDFLPKISDLCL